MNNNYNMNGYNNENPNGYNNGNVRQVIRVSGPIQLDKNGNAIGAPVKRQVIGSQKEQPKEMKTSTFLTIIIILTIIALLTALICFLILPNIDFNASLREEVDNLLTTTTTDRILPSEKLYWSDNTLDYNKETIEGTGEYEIIKTQYTPTDYSNRDYGVLSIKDSGGVYSYSLNDIEFAKGVSIASTYGMQGDKVAFVVQESNEKTKKLYIIDVSTKEIKEISKFNDVGVSIDTVKFDGTEIIIYATRMIKDHIVTSEEWGNTVGINICNEEELTNNDIDTGYFATIIYKITYDYTKKEFNDPVKTTGTSISDYKIENGYCTNN